MTATEPQLKTGRIVGIAGPVVDVEFPPSALPEINAALEFTVEVDGEEHALATGPYGLAAVRTIPAGAARAKPYWYA